MPLNWTEWIGSAGLIVSCLAAVLLVKLLINNTMQQEKFFGALGRCHTELQSASGRLESLCNILDRRFSSFEENSRQSDPVLLNSIQRFDKVAQEIRDRLDDLLLTEGNEKQPVERMSEPVLQEISKLQSHLEEMSGQLKRSNYLSMDENAELGAMRKRIESYQSMVMKARSEAKDSESIMAELRQEIQQLRATPRSAPVTSADSEQLQAQLSDMEQQKRKLEEEIAALNNEKQRNDIEKKFIEDRFMELS